VNGTRAAILAAATVVGVLPSSVGEAAGFEIGHVPVACVPLDKYTRLAATAASASQVVQAEIQFRVDAAAGWYSTRMAPHDGEWSGQLPRPVTPLERFEYRIVMTASDLTTVETPAVSVRVAAAGMPCEDKDKPQFSASVDAPIVVRGPAGAPVVPPVPAGFSPAGVMSPPEPVRYSRALKIGAAATVVAGIAAGVAVAGSGTEHVLLEPSPPPPPALQFSILAVTPPIGSVLSLSSGRVAWILHVAGGAGTPLDFSWRLEFFSRTALCVVMAGAASVGPVRPEDVELTGPFLSTGACGVPFDAEALELTIKVGDEIVDFRRFNRGYRFEP
jgi:hypothetical protein